MISGWKKGAALLNALLQQGTCSIHALSDEWAESFAYYRFLNNTKVEEGVLIDKLRQQCHKRVAGKRVIAIADTTEMNCQGNVGRLRCRRDLGPLSDNRTLGYLLHPVYCLDADTRFPLGIAHVRIWHRAGDGRRTTRRARAITEKEADKWYSDLLSARDTVLAETEHTIFVMDREADNYAVLERLANAQTDFVIRSAHDRVVRLGNRRYLLRSALEQQPVKGTVRIELQNHERCGQCIRAHVRYTPVRIQKPKGRHFLADTADEVSLFVVEVKEVGHHRQNRVCWRLLTSCEVTNMAQAIEVIDIYKCRWEVEQLFRLMKTEAFDVESSALGKGSTLRKLGLFVLEAAVKIAQLKAARSQESPVRTTAIFTSQEIACLYQINQQLAGTTVKLSNPYPQESLSWASWIIARLGGWKGYRSQRPPGPITFKRGLERYEQILLGFNLQNQVMYKP